MEPVHVELYYQLGQLVADRVLNILDCRFGTTAMLRVFRASGQLLLADDTAEDLRLVANLKRQIRRIHGIPSCVQRFTLLSQTRSSLGENSELDVQIVGQSSCQVDESSELNLPVDLQLVLLTAPETMKEAEDEFMELAVTQGNADLAKNVLELGLGKTFLIAQRPS